MKLIFTNQYFELLLLVNGLAMILYYAAIKKKRQRAMKFGNYETLQKVAGQNFLRSNKLLLVLKMAALTALIIGISSPVVQEEVIATDSDYVLAIDSSASMLSSDIDPTRLEAAKTVARNFVDSTSNSTEVGVVAFSGSINQRQRLTSRKPVLRAAIENISIGRKAGTAIGDAIYAATTMVMGSDQERKIILVTDGRNNVGSSINNSLQYAIDQNVTINTVSIGKENRTTEVQNESRAQFPHVNFQQLRMIAKRTNGTFTTATDRAKLKEAFMSVEKTTTRRDVSRYFIFLALVLLLTEWGLGTTKYDILP